MCPVLEELPGQIKNITMDTSIESAEEHGVGGKVGTGYRYSWGAL